MVSPLQVSVGPGTVPDAFTLLGRNLKLRKANRSEDLHPWSGQQPPSCALGAPSSSSDRTALETA